MYSQRFLYTLLSNEVDDPLTGYDAIYKVLDLVQRGKASVDVGVAALDDFFSKDLGLELSELVYEDNE